MPTAAYNFNEQLTKGNEGEQTLDRYFSRYYSIYAATQNQQRLGIDRIFVCLRRQSAWAVEYKMDVKASSTGNAFIETISVDSSDGQTYRCGWVHTSQCHYLVYYLPQQNRVYLLSPERLRQKVQSGNWSQFPQKTAQNDGYKTHGLLVPLDEIKRIADKIINIGVK